jgi:GTP-sensing pleiotropic transcriptional regulator CodY
MEDGGRLAPMAAELVDRLAIVVAVRRFPSMGVADSRSLRSNFYIRMRHFVRRTTFIPFRR